MTRTMRRTSQWLGVAIAGAIAVGATACDNDGGSRPDGGTDGGIDDGRQTVVEVPVTPNRDLDLLFVVDDSPSMLDKQTNLANNFPNFINRLAQVPGGLPNLHLGV